MAAAPRRILEEGRGCGRGGELDAAEDVFLLRAEDLAADPSTWRGRAADRGPGSKPAGTSTCRATAARDAIEARPRRAARADGSPGPERFVGIGLGQSAVEGPAVARLGWPRSWAARSRSGRILVVATLEPSWAVVFPRFAGVVTELGGELSHASILLREAGIPAVVNAPGSTMPSRRGDRLRLDGGQGVVEVRGH